MDLLPCPFCGRSAAFERLGTPRQSCIIVCEWCGCRLETNEVGAACGSQWNRRSPIPPRSFTLSLPDAAYAASPQLLVRNKEGQQFGIVVEEKGRWLLHGLTVSQVIGTAPTLWGLFPIIEEYLIQPAHWIHSTGFYK